MLTLWNRLDFSRAFGPLILAFVLCAGLSGCGGAARELGAEANFPKSQHDKEMAKYGSIFDTDNTGDGFVLWDSKEKRAARNMALGTGVNAWLWQASLDTIGFLPLASADSNGGMIITDWYSAPGSPQERIKVNIRIKDATLRSDGVKVSVFRQTSDGKGGWVDASVSPKTGTKLEDTILARARQLKMDAGQDKKKKKKDE